jgi:hypothetical protein
VRDAPIQACRLHPADNKPLVLLLDEADVFLEERSLADLERNSLVSGESHEDLHNS